MNLNRLVPRDVVDELAALTAFVQTHQPVGEAELQPAAAGQPATRHWVTLKSDG